MELLGIGPLELVFILIIVLLVFGPKDIARGARSVGRGLNRLYRSENYKIISKASTELRNLPARLAREANLDELEEINRQIKPDAAQDPYRAWTTPAASSPEPKPAPEAPAGQTGAEPDDAGQSPQTQSPPASDAPAQ